MQNKFLDTDQKRIPYISINGKPLASLVVLSFNRPEYLHRTIASLKRFTTYPYELIVVDDGSFERANSEFLLELYRAKQLSCLILNPGLNQGVGASINKGFRCSHGKYLFKLDSDLEFTPFWLEKTIGIMETFPEIGVLGLFHYHYDPCDARKMFIRKETRDGLTIEVHQKQVGSTMVFHRRIYDKYGDFTEGSHSFGEDYVYKKHLREEGLWTALPEGDFVRNYGFGEPYTSLLYKGERVDVSKIPLVFRNGRG